MAEKKKLKDTKIGQFLIEKAPKVAEVVGGLLPDKGVLGIVKNLINSATDVPEEVKKEFNEKEVEFELELAKLNSEERQSEDKERSERHKNDMLSDSWLSKNIRPLTLIYLLLFLTVIIILDSSLTSFQVDEAYISLLKVLLVSVFIFYFGGRELTKMMSVSKGK